MFEGWRRKFKGKRLLIATSLLLFIILYIRFPDPLFNTPYSTVVESESGELLGARIADDGQWRFPQPDSVPHKFEKSVILFEDRYFYSHPGFNPVSFFRAFRSNIKSKGKVIGGSTISMQLIRLSRGNQQRTILEKLIELFMAIRLELSHSKSEILSGYSSHAPFGGNVVGLQAAAWKYFGTSAEQLSWAQSALLAVLPNAPSLIYPGKNDSVLKRKRDGLLKQLFDKGYISKQDHDLACLEPLPNKPVTLPRITPHLLDRFYSQGGKGKRIRTSIKISLQQRLNELVDLHQRTLEINGINNSAALIIEVKTGNVLAYSGNTDDPYKRNGNEVDVITAPRSTGSILKPLLYTAMLQDGMIVPSSLIQDVPTQIGNYQPKNFKVDYDGAIQAKMALARSLNVPAVKMLQKYGVARFHDFLKNMGMTTLTYSPDHYGLSLILGGAEGSLWDISGMYASMARALNNYNETGKSSDKDFHPALLDAQRINNSSSDRSGVDPLAIWQMFEAIVEVSRPEQDASWKLFSSSKRIAWKTGTSFGYRDGWAIGTTPEYVVGVWVGNASGEGRPELTGIAAAAPLMFNIFNTLPSTTWFKKPDGLKKIKVCSASGYMATALCEEKVIVEGTKHSERLEPCPYHQLIHLDKTASYQVSADCYPADEIVHKSWFVLPPSIEWFYKRKDPSYKPLPQWKTDCYPSHGTTNMDFIYPKQSEKIYVPLGIDGQPGKVVFRIAHRKPNVEVFWHLDNTFIRTTSGFHEVELNPEAGKHIITVMDAEGSTLRQEFEILRKGS